MLKSENKSATELLGKGYMPTDLLEGGYAVTEIIKSTCPPAKTAESCEAQKKAIIATHSNKNKRGGAIAGIVVVLLCVGIVGSYIFYRHRLRTKNQEFFKNFRSSTQRGKRELDTATRRSARGAGKGKGGRGSKRIQDTGNGGGGGSGNDGGDDAPPPLPQKAGDAAEEKREPIAKRAQNAVPADRNDGNDNVDGPPFLIQQKILWLAPASVDDHVPALPIKARDMPAAVKAHLVGQHQPNSMYQPAAADAMVKLLPPSPEKGAKQANLQIRREKAAPQIPARRAPLACQDSEGSEDEQGYFKPHSSGFSSTKQFLVSQHVPNTMYEPSNLPPDGPAVTVQPGVVIVPVTNAAYDAWAVAAAAGVESGDLYDSGDGRLQKQPTIYAIPMAKDEIATTATTATEIDTSDEDDEDYLTVAGVGSVPAKTATLRRERKLPPSPAGTAKEPARQANLQSQDSEASDDEQGYVRPIKPSSAGAPSRQINLQQVYGSSDEGGGSGSEVEI